MIAKLGDVIVQENGHRWQYYIENHFAWTPMYMNGTFVWLQPYWQTWPVDLTLGRSIDLYRVNLPFDPRTIGSDRS